MLKRALRSAARSVGLEVFRAKTFRERWSHTVEHYYPVNPRPRWMTGQSPRDNLLQALEHERPSYEQFLAQLENIRDLLHGIPHEKRSADPIFPYWNNPWFSGLDAAALVNIILWKRPRRYFEIGSGHSTAFARYAIEKGDLKTKMISIDPNPRREIDRTCDRVIRQPLEECELAEFDELEAGDILFLDGSHRIFTNSDVTVFFFELLPRLRPGILVHVHDIFLPEDYPATWSGRLYSEQYLIAAMLMCGDRPFRVIAPNFFICRDAVLGDRVRAVFRPLQGATAIPFEYGPGVPGVSFWFETKQPSVIAR
jgi:hypothetical protein